MSKRFWLISFISLLALLGIVIVVSSLKVDIPEVAAVPTQAMLPSVTADQFIQPTLQPTPLPQAVSVPAHQSVSDASAAVKPVAADAPTAQPQTSTSLEQPAVGEVVSQPLVTAAPPLVIPLPPAPVPNQIVIHFDPSSSAQARAAYIQQIGGTVSQNIEALNTVVVNVAKDTADQQLPSSPIVTTSEPDYFVVALDDPAVNDPLYASQWALPVVNAPAAWSALPANTPSVPVAVIDSGVCASHPDLVGRILPGYDFIDHDTTPQDDFGHGCGVSGIIAANPNNTIGIAGVAPNALIMPLRVLNGQGIGTYSDVAAALVYAADNGAKIANLSLGGSSPSTVLEEAVTYAVGHGVLVIAAAGNTGGSVLYPAAYPAVVAVASVDSNLQRSSFSSFGPEVDLLAPGRNILTTTRDGNYATMSGTSFSAPVTAGIAALEQAMGRTLTLDGGIVAFGGGTPVVQQPTATPTPILPTSTPDVEKELFSAVDSATLDQLGLVESADAHTKRSRFVNVNTDLLGNAADFASKTQADTASDTIVLNLFDDVMFTAVRTSYKPMASGSVLWHGYLQGLAYGSVDLVVNNGILSGNVYLVDATYEIRYSGQGNAHIVRDIDIGSYAEEKDDVNVQASVTSEDFVNSTADNGSRIDVLVVYTATTRAAAGGTTAIQTTIDLAEQDTNQSYIDSGINQRINVVNSTEVTYAETGNSGGDLNCIQAPSDGCLDNIQTLRDTYHADIVVFIEESVGAGLCGQAFNILGAGGSSTVTHAFEPYAFLVVSRGCSVSNHSFAHELGHLMSARHDYYVDPTTNSPYSYNHGYVYTPGAWRTIMAYNDACAALGFNCTRLRIWSNPNVTVNGVPAGRAEGQANAADNHKALNNTAVTVANFRDSTIPDDFSSPVTILIPNYTTTLDTSNANTATDDPLLDCQFGQRYNTVWYRFTPPQDGTLTVNTFGSSYDTVLNVWTGTRGSLVSQACNDDYDFVGGNVQSQVILGVTGGVTYSIEAASYNIGGGTLNLNLIFDGPQLLAAPALVSPTNNLLLTDSTTTFTWNAVTNGDQYHIQVDDTANFGSAEVNTNVSTLDFTPPADLADGVYYWRVQALDVNSFAGLWSTVWNFTLDSTPPAVPVLIAPADNPVGFTNNKPIFSWQSVPTATHYQLLLDTVNPPVRSVQNAALTTYTPANILLTGVTYYWCVKAYDAAGNGSNCSEIRSLTLESAPNAAPFRNYYLTSTPTLTWNRVTWAVAYEIQIDDNTNFLSQDYDAVIPADSTLSHTVTTTLPTGIWNWRMRAKHSDGTWGAWSPFDTFAIVAP